MEPAPPAPSADLQIARSGGLVLVTLDRPKALNALSLGMIETLLPAVAAWAADPDVTAVAIRGAGGRAFCAGGDVRAVWQAGQAVRRGEADPATARRFFAQEYRLNHAIATFPKPWVALIDGICMGGGLGLSIHGSDRLVAPGTVMAMPEMAIGLIPDIGATHFLSRLPGALGTYLALTGARLTGGDAVALGLGTLPVPADRFAGALDLLSSLPPGGGRGAAAPVLAPLAVPDPETPILGRRAFADRHFGRGTVTAIRASLAEDPSPAAREAESALDQGSPTSHVVTLEALRRARLLDLAGCLAMEYRLVQGCLAHDDFYEGVRAVLIDKTRDARFRPGRAADVSADLVAAHFDPPGADTLIF